MKCPYTTSFSIFTWIRKKKMSLSTPPSVVPFNDAAYGHLVKAPPYERFSPLLEPDMIAIMASEIRDEIDYVLDDEKMPSWDEHRLGWYYPNKVYWLSATGNRWLHNLFPDIPDEVEGMHKCLKWIVENKQFDWEMMGDALQALWQGVWLDATIELYPSPYTVFIRNTIMPLVPEDERETWSLRVRDSAIVVERARQQLRLDRALLTPHVVSRRLLMNGLRMCWIDLLDKEDHQTNGLLNQRQRAAFVLAMLMLGSRFKGVAVNNTYTIIKGKPEVWLSGLSKSKDSSITVRRPLNLKVASEIGVSSRDRMGAFVYAFFIARGSYHEAMHKRDGDPEDIESVRYTLNLLRKEVKRYIETVFPGLLRFGESTHLLRKIYLQLAFETYGAGMKETGFAAKVFAHEGYATALHYTSVILSD